MAGVSSITTTVAGVTMHFHAVTRIEAVGARLRWKLHTRDPRIAGIRAGAQAGTPADPSPRLVGPIEVVLAGGQKLSINGPFRIADAPRRTTYPDELMLQVEQTVETPASLVPGRAAYCVPANGIEGFLNTDPFSGSLQQINQAVRKKIQGMLEGIGETVVLRVDRSPLDLAAWLAWSASYLGEDHFWVIGRAGTNWSLVKDDNQQAFDMTADWRPTYETEICCKELPTPYARRAGLVEVYQRVSEVTLDEATQLLTKAFLPKRANFAGNHRWIVRRRDTWATGPVGWESLIDIADAPPEPVWQTPDLAPMGYLRGKVAKSWTSGVSVQCTMDGCNDLFPARLTSFDAGTGNAFGWQWVPSEGNTLCLDPDWSLTGMPLIRYAQRDVEVPAPYAMALPTGKQWSGKTGMRKMTLSDRGMRVD
ncbi:hypothetical protein [Humisphaera borealis]|uniref:Uncharacterized protein n=1 Tax=Humisphaera borealis TaxID=2807512 RepID=A0A7M2X0C7_9BACT|nr:hypothetical protein [Humisphaera borealis]QOV90190.1 hypothetical protein IPV69_02110 [Humisphaera borealis]